ncbi:MAG: hypothetical protein AB9882_03085 [Ignavibacteriaceae bacterium]
MPNSNKYASLLIDLDFLETQVEILTSRFNELLKQNSLLQNQLKDLQSENESLRSQLNAFETEVINVTQGEGVNSLEIVSEDYRVALKEKISSAISKIDNCLAKL